MLANKLETTDLVLTELTDLELKNMEEITRERQACTIMMEEMLSVLKENIENIEKRREKFFSKVIDRIPTDKIYNVGKLQVKTSDKKFFIVQEA